MPSDQLDYFVICEEVIAQKRGLGKYIKANFRELKSIYENDPELNSIVPILKLNCLDEEPCVPVDLTLEQRIGLLKHWALYYYLKVERLE